MFELPTTMKDIAEHLCPTVSRALNGSARVQRGEAQSLSASITHEHSFYPNDITPSRCATHKQPVKVIGVIVPEFTHYFSSILNGIEDAASKARLPHHCHHVAREQYERRGAACQMFEAHQVCGVIVSQAKEGQGHAHFQSLIDRGIPLVFLRPYLHG